MTSILIMSSVILIIGLTASVGALMESRMALSFEKASQSLSLANLCAERAIWELKQDENYEGGEELLVEGNSCFIMPIEWWNEEGRIVVGEGRVDDHRKRVRVRLSQIDPDIVVSSWEDVLAF